MGEGTRSWTTWLLTPSLKIASGTGTGELGRQMTLIGSERCGVVVRAWMHMDREFLVTSRACDLLGELSARAGRHRRSRRREAERDQRRWRCRWREKRRERPPLYLPF